MDGIKELLNKVCDARIQSELQSRIKTNDTYRQLLEEAEKSAKDLEQFDFAEAQLLAVDNRISISNALGGIYGTEAYKLGLEDGAKAIISMFET